MTKGTRLDRQGRHQSGVCRTDTEGKGRTRMRSHEAGEGNAPLPFPSQNLFSSCPATPVAQGLLCRPRQAGRASRLGVRLPRQTHRHHPDRKSRPAADKQGQEAHVVPVVGARGKHVCSGRSAQCLGPVRPAAEGEEEGMLRPNMVPRHTDDGQGSGTCPECTAPPSHLCSSCPSARQAPAIPGDRCKPPAGAASPLALALLQHLQPALSS